MGVCDPESKLEATRDLSLILLSVAASGVYFVAEQLMTSLAKQDSSPPI